MLAKIRLRLTLVLLKFHNRHANEQASKMRGGPPLAAPRALSAFGRVRVQDIIVRPLRLGGGVDDELAAVIAEPPNEFFSGRPARHTLHTLRYTDG